MFALCCLSSKSSKVCFGTRLTVRLLVDWPDILEDYFKLCWSVPRIAFSLALVRSRDPPWGFRWLPYGSVRPLYSGWLELEQRLTPCVQRSVRLHSLVVVLCPAVWNFTLCLCRLVFSQRSRPLCGFWKFSLCIAPSSLVLCPTGSSSLPSLKPRLCLLNFMRPLCFEFFFAVL